jgi:ribosome-binding factor A
MRVLKVKCEIERTLLTSFARLNLFSAVIRNILISKDLKYVTCVIGSINPDLSDAALLTIINRKIHLIKRDVKKHICLRNFPVLRFVNDDHFERINAIEKIMEKIKNEDVAS